VSWHSDRHERQPDIVNSLSAPGVQARQPHHPRRVGPFDVLGILGAGGMGQVYLAADATRLVAVKVVHPGLASDQQFRVRFAREVEAGQRVRGPWTAAVVDADPAARLPWLASAYVPGVSLSHAVTSSGPLPPAVITSLATHLAHALAAIHDAGLVHRDVKPGNVLLGPEHAIMIDFGISRAPGDTRMTSTGVAVGTPAFMSPEQAEGTEPGTASDVFSLGAVLVWAATGQGPFGDGTPIALLRKILTASPGLGALTGPVRELVADCLQRDPAARPTAAQLVEQLHTRLGQVPHGAGWLPPAVATLLPDPSQILAIAPATEPAAPQPATARRRVSRRALFVGGGAAVAVAAAAPLIWWATAGSPPPPAAPAAPQPYIRWSFRTPRPPHGQGSGEGAVYVVDASSTFYAIDQTTGQLLWSGDPGASPPQPDPAAESHLIIQIDSGPTVRALDTATGVPKWEIDRFQLLSEDSRDDVNIGLGVDLERGRVRAFDSATGAPLWEDTGQSLPRPPDAGAVAFGADRLHVGGLDGTFVTFDAASGDVLWSRPTADRITVVGVADDVVWYRAVGDTADQSSVVALDPVTGAERWRHDLALEQRCPSATDQGMLFLAMRSSGFSVQARDLASGAERWTRPVADIMGASSPQSRINTPVVVSGGTCYVGIQPDGPGSRGAAFRLAALDSDTGAVRWSFPLDVASSWEGLVQISAVPGTAFVSTTSGVHAVSQR
jgi:outer membrane protein assembly factor BamB